MKLSDLDAAVKKKKVSKKTVKGGQPKLSKVKSKKARKLKDVDGGSLETEIVTSYPVNALPNEHEPLESVAVGDDEEPPRKKLKNRKSSGEENESRHKKMKKVGGSLADGADEPHILEGDNSAAAVVWDDNSYHGDDKVLQCEDCGVDFLFSARFKRFLKAKGFHQRQLPRCEGCQFARRHPFETHPLRLKHPKWLPTTIDWRDYSCRGGRQSNTTGQNQEWGWNPDTDWRMGWHQRWRLTEKPAQSARGRGGWSGRGQGYNSNFQRGRGGWGRGETNSFGSWGRSGFRGRGRDGGSFRGRGRQVGRGRGGDTDQTEAKRECAWQQPAIRAAAAAARGRYQYN